MKFYGTFGAGQTLFKNFVVVEAEDTPKAHEKMSEHYGRMWACIYTEQAFQGQAEAYGLSEVPLGTENKRLDEARAEAERKIMYGNTFGVQQTIGGQIVITAAPGHAIGPFEALVLAAWIQRKVDALSTPHDYGEIIEIVERLEDQ